MSKTSIICCVSAKNSTSLIFPYRYSNYSPGYLLCIFLCFFFTVVCTNTTLYAATYTISSLAELESALNIAQSNNEDDILNISAGTYQLTSTISYDSHEDKSISLQGTGGETILEGNGTRVIFIRTYSSNADIALDGITFKNGYAPEGANGAGLFINISTADLIIDNCKIIDSFAAAFYFSNDGGGGYVTAGLGANVTIRNTVIAGNSAKGKGGGLYLNITDGVLIFINNTIVGNHNKTNAIEYGGGLFLNLYFDRAEAYLHNNIFWENTYSQGNGDIYISNQGYGSGIAASVTFTNNNILSLQTELQQNLTVNSNTSHDPQLTADYHLPTGSASIDAGDATVANLPSTDIDGEPRSLDGRCSGVKLPDQGSDEYYSPPVLTTISASQITSTSAFAGGNIISHGGHPLLSRGICWSGTTMPGLTDTCSSEGTETGLFASSIAGLINATTYYVRPYAENCEGLAFGDQVQFTTTELPTVTTAEVSYNNAPSARSGGNILGSGDSPVTEKGLCWSTSSVPDINDSCTSNGSGTSAFTSTLRGLSADTTYYYRAYAINSQGIAYGNEKSFLARRLFPWNLFAPAIMPEHQQR